MGRHTHKYRRLDISSRGSKEPYWVMQCQLPNCNHYYPMKTKLSAPGLWGKHAICNDCGAVFELDRRALRQSYPSCVNCIESPKKKVLDSAAHFFSNLEKEMGIDTLPVGDKDDTK